MCAETMRISKFFLIMLFIANVFATRGLVLKDVICLEMLRLHVEALLFVVQSHKISSAALFVIVYVFMVGISLPGAAIASIVGSFLFGIMFDTVLNIGANTL